MPEAPPLAGLRVLELATGIAGPYAGRLLALLGATVVKLEPDGGDPARAWPVDDRALAGTSPLYLHLNAGKQSRRRSAAELARLVDWAQIVLDERVRAELDGAEPDPRRARLLVSVTPWGFEHEPGGGIADELLVQAASGVMLADPESREPRRFPGWQAQVHAGAYAAAAALAALALPGVRHVDVPWVGAMLAGVEGTLAPVLHQRGRATSAAQAGVQAAAFPAGVFRCADGFVIPGTVRPIDWDLQCAVYGMPELLADARFDRRGRFPNREALRAAIQPWYGARTKQEIFAAALDAGWAAAMVLTAGDALRDPHLRARGFFASAREGAQSFELPAAPWRAPGLPAGSESARVAALGEHDAAPLPATETTALPPLRGVRILELTRAWAGPFVGRFLGALGADVVKLEGARSPDGWRARMRFRSAGIDVPDGVDPAAYTWDAAALYNGLNRNKRHLSLDLSREGARELALELAAAADVLVVNMTQRVLADFGLEYATLAARNPRLVLVNLPALGASGPYRAMPGYGMLIEGMGGFAARYGSRAEPARASATYYPDAVAGIHATLAVLAALAARERTGHGAAVDLSQQETTWLQLGEALALASRDGREPERLGDAEPRCAPSGVYATADGHVALVVCGDAELAGLVRAARGALDGLAELDLAARLRERDSLDARVQAFTRAEKTESLVASLRAHGVPARAVTDFRLPFPAELARLEPCETVAHPLTRERAYLRVPLRLDGAPISTRRAAPLFDQHTDEVLADWLGAPAERVAALRAARVVGDTPRAGS